MFYVKNITRLERAIRVLMGFAGMGFAAANLGTFGVAVAIGAMGVLISLTGVMGYCPLCAVAGRKPNKEG